LLKSDIKNYISDPITQQQLQRLVASALFSYNSYEICYAFALIAKFPELSPSEELVTAGEMDVFFTKYFMPFIDREVNKVLRADYQEAIELEYILLQLIDSKINGVSDSLLKTMPQYFLRAMGRDYTKTIRNLTVKDEEIINAPFIMLALVRYPELIHIARKPSLFSKPIIDFNNLVESLYQWFRKAYLNSDEWRRNSALLRLKYDLTSWENFEYFLFLCATNLDIFNTQKSVILETIQNQHEHLADKISFVNILIQNNIYSDFSFRYLLQHWSKHLNPGINQSEYNFEVAKYFEENILTNPEAKKYLINYLLKDSEFFPTRRQQFEEASLEHSDIKDKHKNYILWIKDLSSYSHDFIFHSSSVQIPPLAMKLIENGIYTREYIAMMGAEFVRKQIIADSTSLYWNNTPNKFRPNLMKAFEFTQSNDQLRLAEIFEKKLDPNYKDEILAQLIQKNWPYLNTVFTTTTPNLDLEGRKPKALAAFAKILHNHKMYSEYSISALIKYGSEEDVDELLKKASEDFVVQQFINTLYKKQLTDANYLFAAEKLYSNVLNQQKISKELEDFSFEKKSKLMSILNSDYDKIMYYGAFSLKDILQNLDKYGIADGRLVRFEHRENCINHTFFPLLSKDEQATYLQLMQKQVEINKLFDEILSSFEKEVSEALEHDGKLAYFLYRYSKKTDDIACAFKLLAMPKSDDTQN
jgi:hypothetical protein